MQSDKATHLKHTRSPVAPGPKAAPSDGAPRPRGAWKDDPVCFGEGAPDTLPTVRKFRR